MDAYLMDVWILASPLTLRMLIVEKTLPAVARENGCNLLVNNAGVDRTRFPEVCLEVSTTNTQSWGKERTIVNFTT